MRKRFHPLLALIAALLEANTWRLHKAAAVLVHDDPTGFESAGNAVDTTNVAAPDAGRQTIVGIVRDANGVRLVLKPDDSEYGPKDLLTRDLHIVADAQVDGRLDEPALPHVRRLCHAAANGRDKAEAAARTQATAASSLSTKASWIDDCTSNRVPAAHHCPPFQVKAVVHPFAAASRSASAKTILADFPPSSIVSSSMRSAAIRPNSLPARVLSVNEILRTGEFGNHDHFLDW